MAGNNPPEHEFQGDTSGGLRERAAAELVVELRRSEEELVHAEAELVAVAALEGKEVAGVHLCLQHRRRHFRACCRRYRCLR